MSSEIKETVAERKNAYRIPASSAWAGAWKIAAGIGALGLAGSAAGFFTDPGRFAFSYLFAFFLVLTIALGSLFFILVERLTSAGWSITARRTAEFFAAGTPVFIVLVLPLLASMGTLYPWLHEKAGENALEKPAHAEPAHAEPAHEAAPAPVMHEVAKPAAGEVWNGAPNPAGPLLHEMHTSPIGPNDHDRYSPKKIGISGPEEESPAVAHAMAAHEDPEEVQEEQTIRKKSPWLNRNAFIARAFLYVIVWAVLGLTFFRYSTGQDTTKDPKLTLKAQKLAPAATFIFGFTLTGAAFDWLMSLAPTWYSTIFGVTIFAGSVVAMYATLILVTMALNDAGYLKNAVNVEHYHDLGKLMFGFLIFWAYVSFAQFMLIWYASIPEETTFYHSRWDVGPWKTVSIVIIFCHFIIPFFMVLSRNAKRKLSLLRFGALWLIVMHAVEMYWFVMPMHGHGESGFHWLDIACLLGVGGVYLAVVFRRMADHPLIPIGDPRLSRALTFENA